jgi:hypothetical protein
MALSSSPFRPPPSKIEALEWPVSHDLPLGKGLLLHAPGIKHLQGFAVLGKEIPMF